MAACAESFLGHRTILHRKLFGDNYQIVKLEISKHYFYGGKKIVNSYIVDICFGNFSSYAKQGVLNKDFSVWLDRD
jgi:hypothetical protein